MVTRYLNFKLFKSEAGYQVRFSQDGGLPIEAPFQVELREGRLAGVIAKIENDNCTRDDLRDLGSQMWTGLTADPVGPRVTEALRQTDCFFQIRLDLPPELEQLPWEALYDIDRAIFFAGYPGYCLIRDPLVEAEPVPAAEAPRQGLHLLAVVPEGSGLAIEQELNNLRRLVNLENLQISDLRGRVTPDTIREKLQLIRPDIFHFVGHGEFDSADNVRIRLNSEEGGQNEFWAQAEQFSMTFAQQTVRLAVFNCCYAGRTARTSLSGLGPLLLRGGVPAVVGMRYPIAEQTAQRFSVLFYNALLKGENRGRVDLALQHARYSFFVNATEDQWRSVITPVLYLARGHEKLFDIIQQAHEPISLKAPRHPEVLLPDILINQFKQGRCVPIVGSGILRPPTDRLTVAHSTMRSLTEHLSQKCQLGDTNLLEAAEQIGAEIAFQSVAEVYALENMRFSLIDTIHLWYEDAEPGAAHLALATWPVPAIFYTHFDGLLERAFQRQERTPTVVYTLSKTPDLRQGHPVLVLVRGTLTNDETIVLTEQDNEDLASAIDQLPPSVEQITTAVMGRSILFLGVNPRDLIIRKLARRLIRPRGSQGPVFFVCPKSLATDKAYWSTLNVTWLEAEPDAVIAKLTTLLTG